MGNILILTSYGLTTRVGRELIGKELKAYDLTNKKIFLFHEPYYSTETILVQACLNLGFKKENIIISGQQTSKEEVLECDIYYCGEGNTFEILSIMRESGLDNIFKKGFSRANKIYIGCSAGAAIAGTSVEEMRGFDRNLVGMVDYEALGLIDGIIIPHCTKQALKSFISTRVGMKEKYNKVLSVSDEESLVLEVQYEEDLDSLQESMMLGLLRDDSDDIEESETRPDWDALCEELKQMRIKLAEANGIDLETVECNSTGPCAGTCARCDSELLYLQEQLSYKKEEDREYPFVAIESNRTKANVISEKSSPLMGVSIPTRKNPTNKGE